MSYLYTGQFELGEYIENQIKTADQSHIQNQVSNSSYLSNCNPHVNVAVDYLIDFMRIADEYLLEDVKNHCQNELINLIDESTY